MPPSRKLNGPSKSDVRMPSTDQALFSPLERSKVSGTELQAEKPSNAPRLSSRVSEVHSGPPGP